jgi:hypothetical protein
MKWNAAIYITVFAVCAQHAAPAICAEFMDANARHELEIDLNGDGAMERAVLEQGPDGLDLSISLSKNGEAAVPDFVRKALGEGVVSGLAKGNSGELLLAYGCGGCRDDTTSVLSINLKDNEFVVSRYQLDWETREGSGTCVIDYAGNKGELTIDVEDKTTDLKGPFKMKKLSDWDEITQNEACGG